MGAHVHRNRRGLTPIPNKPSGASFTRTPSGLSSYEMLALDVRALPHAARSILDLACGDGYLLQILAQEFPQARLVGVDMSPEELASARMRLAGRAELQLATAHALPLEDGVCDAVTSHFAFMLLDDAPSIAREVSRVLVSGGIFAAVVGGEPRVQSESDVREMLEEHFCEVDVRDELLRVDGVKERVDHAAVAIRHIVAKKR